MKILIVDDEATIREFISEEFMINGHTTQIAHSGQRAIEILKDNYFDVIISDFDMPNGNGLHLLSFVNTLDPRPTFYFASAQFDFKIDKYLNEGVCNIFYKPFCLSYLIAEVESKMRTA